MIQKTLMKNETSSMDITFYPPFIDETIYG